MVKTERVEVKQQISPSNELGVSFGSEEEDGWAENGEDEADY